MATSEWTTSYTTGGKKNQNILLAKQGWPESSSGCAGLGVVYIRRPTTRRCLWLHGPLLWQHGHNAVWPQRPRPGVHGDPEWQRVHGGVLPKYGHIFHSRHLELLSLFWLLPNGCNPARRVQALSGRYIGHHEPAFQILNWIIIRKGQWSKCRTSGPAYSGNHHSILFNKTLGIIRVRVMHLSFQ